VKSNRTSASALRNSSASSPFGLDHPETGIGEDDRSHDAHQRFVFDDQDHGRKARH
jgi:hypothetical protein